MHKLTRTVLALLALVVLAGAALAADPGIDLPNDPALRAASQISDQKKGSVLIYNLYSSGATGVASNNTRISITNTNSTSPVAAHLFFVDGNTCAVADSFLCLTANQTATFFAADLDPGVTGYILVVASNLDGEPIAFDWLIGDEFVKLDSGHTANLGAEAVSVASLPLVVPTVADGAAAALLFNGVRYNQLPRVLAVDNLPSRADGNDTLLVVNRIGGNYAIGAGQIGALFSILYDDAETPFSWSATVNACQLRVSISNNFPRTVPRVETIITAGRSGWMRFWSNSTDNQTPFEGATTADPRSLTGVAINRNLMAGSQANAFNGGHNLHKLRLNPITVIIIPIFPPNC